MLATMPTPSPRRTYVLMTSASRAVSATWGVCPARAKMFTPYVAEDPDSVSFYGYGWAIEETPRHGTLVQHNGGNGIFLAELHRWVDEGLTVFVVTTDPALPATPVAATIEAIAFGEPVVEPPAVVRVDPAALARAADGIGEEEERHRCVEFLRASSATGARELGL